MSATIELYAEISTDQILKAPPLPLAREEHAADYAYYALTTHAGARRPRVQAFLGWLEAQVERDARETHSDS